MKFATYTRDGSTGLDYADQHYYSSQYGRFLSPDPIAATGGTNDPTTPTTWNRYMYVVGDPVNSFDATGQYACGSDSGVRSEGTIYVTVYDCADPVVPKPGSYRMTVAEWDDIHPNEALQKLNETRCAAALDGRTLGLNAALGVLGGVSASAEIIFDYHTGNAALVFSGGSAHPVQPHRLGQARAR